MKRSGAERKRRAASPIGRREFLLGAAAAAGLSPKGSQTVPFEQRICLFTDHLGGFSIADAARMLGQLEITGPDLTVRPGGLVLPERVREDLPKAVAAFRDQGLGVPMITTSITSAPQAGPILEAAAQAGIEYYKLGYFHYHDMEHWRERRQQVSQALTELAALGEKLNLHAGFHNHAGPTVGGTIWDALELVEPFDKRWLGLYFDPAHAFVEGGKNGWNFSLRRARPRVTMVAIKDVVWEKAGGEWKTRWVPLGQGMVRFDQVLPLLLETPFPGPVSLHIEYDPGGKTRVERFENSLAAAERDLKILRGLVEEARQAADAGA